MVDYNNAKSHLDKLVNLYHSQINETRKDRINNYVYDYINQLTGEASHNRQKLLRYYISHTYKIIPQADGDDTK